MTRSPHTLRGRIAALASRLSGQPGLVSSDIEMIPPERIDVDVDDDCNLGSDCGGNGVCERHWSASVWWQHAEQHRVSMFTFASTRRGALLAMRDRLRAELRRRIAEDRAALGIRVRPAVEVSGPTEIDLAVLTACESRREGEHA